MLNCDFCYRKANIVTRRGSTWQECLCLGKIWRLLGIAECNQASFTFSIPIKSSLGAAKRPFPAL
jgi:hypothetical protein